MDFDDVIYISLLAFSITFGYIYKNLKKYDLHPYKKEVGTFVGFVLVAIVSGWHIIHPIVSVLLTILILKFSPRSKCHTNSFFWLFGQLFFYRTCHYFGLPEPPNHTNAIQMVLALKLIGLCFEVHDTWLKKEQLKTALDEETKKKLQLELKYESVEEPSALDIFHYSFCYVGVLVGPYFKFRVYQDMLNPKSTLENKGLDCIKAMYDRIKVLPLYAVLFVLSDYFYPLKFAASEAIFRDYSILYRIWYMTPVFFNFRMRIYGGFVLAECVCIMAGLGAYPSASKSRPGKGPTDFEALENSESATNLEYDFETIHNINEYGSEFTPTVRLGMRNWNMTIQYWLATNVYKRLNLAKPIKEIITMLVSALWHGVHPGYYLSLLTVPFILAVEDYYERIVRRKLGETSQKIYDWWSWFWKMQNFAYMGMAFLLLRIDTTMHYWQSIGFIYHGFILIAHGIAQYINLVMGKAEKKLKKGSKLERIGDSRFTLKKQSEDELRNSAVEEKKEL